MKTTMQKITGFVGQFPEKFSQRKLPKVPIIIVAIIAGAIGTYALIHSLAATTQPSIYWGSWIDGDTYGGRGDAPWDSTTWDMFESHAGKKVSIDHYGQPPMWEQAFSASTANLVTNRGAIPLMDMSSKSYSLKDIASGKYDSTSTLCPNSTCLTISSWADAVKAWGKPFFFRWDWEMNGKWFPWGAQAKQDPAAFKAAWQHIHDVVVSRGATNVTWVWCPNTVFTGSTTDTSSTPLNQLYPGDSYVDWTCIDGYNKGPLDGDSWKSFSQVFQATYDQLINGTPSVAAIAPSKPIMIGETASNENGGSKATWITDALQTQLPNNFPKVKAFVWFNWPIYENNVNQQWPIESSSGAQAAFASGIASPIYATNTFGSLPLLTKVQPLSGQSTTPPPDTTPPTVSITAPANGATLSGASITVSANASDDTGVAGVQFKLDGNNLGSEDSSSPYSTAWNTTSAANGTHTLTAVARDAAGNKTTAAAQTVTVSNSTPDTTPPDTTITANPAASTTSTSASFSFISSESNSTFMCKLDSGSFAACTSPKAYSGLSVGSHTFSVEAIDAANNQDASPATYTWIVANPLDATNPTVSFSLPTNGSTVSGIVTATAIASDNVGVSKVELYLDGSLKMTDTASPYTYSFDSKTLSNGSHNLTAKAYDAAGNSSTTTITVNVNNPDITPPNAPTGLSATATGATTVSLKWTASTDTGSNPTGVVRYNILRDGVVIAQTSTVSYTDTTAATASTSYSYVVQAVDGAGNVSGNSNTATVTTPAAPDTTPPSTPTNLAAVAISSNQVNLSWNASTDSGGSGVAGYNIYRGSTKLNGAPVTGTTYGDSTVSASTTYSYTVEAVDGAGNKSAQTAAVSVTTPASLSSGGTTHGHRGHGHTQTTTSTTSTTSTDTASSVDITVVDTSNEPVVGTAVTVDGQTSTTDAAGRAHFSDIPTGRQQVSIQYNGKSVSKTIHVKGVSAQLPVQSFKVSTAPDKLNPALLLVPLVILVAAGVFIFRPWSGRFASTGSQDETPHVVSSGNPQANTVKPGHRLEKPGTVYSPHDADGSGHKD